MQYHFINQNKCAIENQAIKLYNQIDNKKHYLSQFCCDFHLLEEGCKQWSYNNLKIELKEEYQLKEYIIIDDLKNVFSVIDINEYGQFLRYEELPNNGELKKVRIYVQDCFKQEKYVDVILKIVTPIFEKNDFISTYSRQ